MTSIEYPETFGGSSFKTRFDAYTAHGYSETEAVVAAMLTENTGRHALDSGGAYGRNFERNAHVDFKATPVATPVIFHDRIDYVTVSTFHFLTVSLSYRADLDGDLAAFSLDDDHECEPWPVCIEDWCEARGYPTLCTENTYNGECALDQTLQWWGISTEDPDAHDLYDMDAIILQVHGGCDVRGGYTAPRVFDASIDDYPSIVDTNRVSAYAPRSEDSGDPELEGMPGRVDDAHWWDTAYDGYSLRSEDGESLGDFEIVESDDRNLRGVIRSWDGKLYSPHNGMEILFGF